MPRSRKGRAFSAAELARFLDRLAASGNMTLAADAIGRPVRSLQNRRRADPSFAARCEAALAAFRCGPEAARAFAPAGRSLRTSGAEWVVIRGGPHRGAQLRRARQGQLTAAALELFLRTLSVTANLDLSARSIGVSPHAIADRRRRDVAFDREVREALKLGCSALEAQLLESALAGVDGPLDEDDFDPGAGPDADPWPCPAPLPPMTAAEAFALLEKQRELLSRPKRWNPARDRQNLDLATARLEKALKRFAPKAKPEH